MGANLVVGLGGGRALDASKYIALATELPLVLVPTVVSTGAIIHSMFAKWNGRKISSPKEWPWVDCEHVLVDYDLVLEANDYLKIEVGGYFFLLLYFLFSYFMDSSSSSIKSIFYFL